MLKLVVTLILAVTAVAVVIVLRVDIKEMLMVAGRECSRDVDGCGVECIDGFSAVVDIFVVDGGGRIGKGATYIVT